MEKIKQFRFLQIAALVLLAGLVTNAYAQEAQTMSVDQRVAALKTSLAQSQKNLRQYEWTETTAISLKGEEKSHTLNRCSYGADGKVQKAPMGTPPEAKEKRGVRGKIIEKKKEEISDYMTQAVGLVKLYVPPDPAKIQASKDAGKASLHMIEPGKRARLEFRDYNIAGDVLGVEIDLVTNQLLGLQVSTYLENPQDAVNLDVRFANLEDGTGYPAHVALDAKAKEIKVNIQNADYHKISQ